MSENQNPNPLDQMDETSQSNNGGDSTSDAQVGGGEQGQGAAPAAPQPAAPTPDPVAAPQPPVERPPVQPEAVAPRSPAVSNERDHGIVYGKRKMEIAEVLKQQPKVSFLIPRAEGEDAELAYETVQINGHRMEIKKGVMVQIPQQVAEILAEKYRVQMEAGSDKRVDRDQGVMDRLS